MAKKYYAVRKGLTPGIYEDWETCSSMVNGYPGAEFKSFTSKTEAESYLGIKSSEPGSPVPEPGCAICYVDGSFQQSSKRFSYGVVMFINSKASGLETVKLSKAFSHAELAEMRNVAGEIMGAAEAMKQAKERGLSHVTIYHDYQGIASWCTGQWKTNKKWTQKYKAFYDEISKSLNIKFVKVKGHSGNKFNDLADSLAREALELK